MSSEERKKILQMVEEGKISAEEAASLMKVLAEDTEDESSDEIEIIPVQTGSSYERTAAPEFDRIKARARRFSLIPLWSGILVTVLSAWIIYSIQQNTGTNFWFYCMSVPFFFGVLLITLGAGGRVSRWIYVNVDRRDAKPGDGPRHITLGFPIPFGLIFWIFENFGHNIDGLNNSKISSIVHFMRTAKDTSEPLMVNVDDDDTFVQVYIG